MPQPTVPTPKADSPGVKFDAHVKHLEAALVKTLESIAVHIDGAVENAPKELRFEAEQLRASIGNVKHWLTEVIAGA
jgi:hypothetical protein